MRKKEQKDEKKGRKKKKKVRKRSHDEGCWEERQREGKVGPQDQGERVRKKRTERREKKKEKEKIRRELVRKKREISGEKRIFSKTFLPEEC